MEIITDIIKRELNKQRISITNLSRRLGLHQATVHNMLKRKSVQVSRLSSLCNALQYNFFRELAEEFTYEQPVIKGMFRQKELELNETISKLKEQSENEKDRINHHLLRRWF